MFTEQLAYLSIKIKSLAAEAVLIRVDENKYRQRHKSDADQQSERSRQARAAWLGLKQHRRWDVRREARAALLAFGLIKGMPYRNIEAKCWEEPDWRRVAAIVRKYGGYKNEADALAVVKAWRSSEPELKQAA